MGVYVNYGDAPYENSGISVPAKGFHLSGGVLRGGMIMKGNKGGGLEKQKARWAWLFIAPWIVGIAVFFAVPMAQSVIYSFCNLTVSGNGFKIGFTGLSNYSYLFTKDTFFLQYLTGSVASVFPRVVMITAFSLLIAVVLKERFIGRSLARTVFFFPVIIASGVIISILQDKVMMSGSGVTDMSPGYMFKAPDLVAVFSSSTARGGYEIDYRYYKQYV